MSAMIGSPRRTLKVQAGCVIISRFDRRLASVDGSPARLRSEFDLPALAKGRLDPLTCFLFVRELHAGVVPQELALRSVAGRYGAEHDPSRVRPGDAEVGA